MINVNTLKCPVCGGGRRVTCEDGSICCMECGYVFTLARIDRRRIIKTREEADIRIRRKKKIELENKREDKIRRIIEELSELLGLGKGIIEEASYTSLKVAKRFKGRIDPYVLAGISIVDASRKLGKPRSLNEIMKLLRELGENRRIKDFMKMTRILRKVGLEINKGDLVSYVDSVISAVFNHEEVRRSVDKGSIMDIKRELRARALNIIKRLPKHWIRGKRPYSIATAAVYIAELERAHVNREIKLFSQRILAESTHQSEYTIKERVIDLYNLGVTFLDRTRKERPSSKIMNSSQKNT
ncbi:hypothetical protein DRN86_01700 [Candidatus Geothermarchaeota archaeon]|nr:MAG: hypothetical protein DRN86_01700 [Candidatus Geothermarchaeota archaeon]